MNTEFERFKKEWKERFGFMAQNNPPDSFESIDEVACLISENTLKEVQEGCSNHGCIYDDSPKAVGTNSICKCLQYDAPKARNLITKLRRDLASQNKEFNKAINFALKTDDGLEFLRLWNEGCFSEIEKEWP